MFVETKRDGEATPDLGTLRVDRILMLADEIEKPTRGWKFSMGDIRLYDGPNVCGTPACIAGHTVAMFGSREQAESGVCEDAARLLGFEDGNAGRLFVPDGWGDATPNDPHYTRSRAARVLRHLATTGKVDWNIA